MIKTIIACLAVAAPALALPSNVTNAYGGVLGNGPNASDYVYYVNGSTTVPETMPYTPAGGFGTNGSYPVYHPLSDFDYESLSLALYQELIELDLFHYGLAQFSVADFEAAGLTAADRFLIEFMADQEVGHATLITNMLGFATAPKMCEYKYPFTTVKGFVDFCQKLTRWGESGVYGFLEHLDSRAAAQLLLQSITTEARQQMIFRQFDGLFPMPVWFEAGITQSMAWTLLAPYIVSCPASNLGARKLAWQNFPALNVTNNPSVVPPMNTTQVFNASITPQMNSTALSAPGRNVTFSYEAPGMAVGPNNSYITATSASGAPAYVAWISQLNVTYSAFTATGNSTGYTIQPNGTVFPSYFNGSYFGATGNNYQASADPIINGTMFVALVDSAAPGLNVTSFNLSMLNSHIVAGPAIYQSG